MTKTLEIQWKWHYHPLLSIELKIFFFFLIIYLAIKQEYSMIFCYFWHDQFKMIAYILLVLNLSGDPKEPQWVVLGATLN